MIIVVLLVMIAYTVLTTHRATTSIDVAIIVMGWFAAALAWHRPLRGGVALGTLLTLAMSIPSPASASLTLPLWVPLAAATATGRRKLGIAFGAWYLTAAIVVGGERGVLVDPLLDGLVWVIFVMTPLCIGSALHHYVHMADDLIARQRATLEQTRRALARSLHDTVVSSTTSIVMLAETARLHGGVDPRSEKQFEVIARTGRIAIDQLRQMLELLRESPQGCSLPVDRLEVSVHSQIDKVRSLGVVIDVQIEGEMTRLDDVISTSLTRAFTEAMLNIVKHADLSAPVAVMIDVTGDEAELVVINGVADHHLTGTVAPPAMPPVGDRRYRSFGLVGMREVASAAGGTAHSRRIGDRWVTEIVIPTRPSGKREDGRPTPTARPVSS